MEFHNNDALWGFAIRVVEEIHTLDLNCQLKDPVLSQLFWMETFNWDGPDSHWGQEPLY